MSLADIASRSPSAAKSGTTCSVCRALAELPEADAAGLRSLLANTSWRFSEIEIQVAEDPDTPDWVRSIKRFTYARHARGECGTGEKMRSGLR